MPAPSEHDATWTALQQLALAILVKWSEDERFYRKLHEEAVRTQNLLIRQCWLLGISPTIISRAAEMPESSLFTRLNLRADPDLRRQREAITSGNAWQLKRWTGELEKITEGGEGSEPGTSDSPHTR